MPQIYDSGPKKFDLNSKNHDLGPTGRLSADQTPPKLPNGLQICRPNVIKDTLRAANPLKTAL